MSQIANELIGAWEVIDIRAHEGVMLTVIGDELTICAASAGHDRPTDFSLTNQYHTIHRYRRSKAIR